MIGQDDWTALKALYESTNSNNSWNNTTGWNTIIANQNSPSSSCNLANLYGVQLNANGRVSELDLQNNNLSDQIPDEIGLLTDLTTLNFNNNDFWGIIPRGLCNLEKIEILNLGNREFGCTIPQCLKNLTNLETLSLGGLQLFGGIPCGFSELSNLTFIEVEGLYNCLCSDLAVLCSQLTNISGYWVDFCFNGANNMCECGGPSGEQITTLETNYSSNVQITESCQDQFITYLSNEFTEVFDHSNCDEYCCPIPIYDLDDKAAGEVFWATGIAFQYFEDIHNTSLETVHSYVNSNENNNPNQASYVRSEKAIYYGAGDGINRTSMTAPDIVGHEIVHHLIASINKMGNYGEFGALQESFADIFGEMIEFECRGSNDWVFGSDVYLPNGGNPIGVRSLSNPLETGHPNFYEGQYWEEQNDMCFFDDFCGIHTNSGVQNYWFYLLSEGGSGINEDGIPYSITGIGKEKAAKITFENLKNISTLYGSVKPYYRAMFGAIDAAKNLFGENSNEVVQTRKAWRAVGLYEADVNPITWRVTNQIINGEIYTDANGNEIIPMSFDLMIDSLANDLSADDLNVKLQMPNGIIFQDITALSPLQQGEIGYALNEREAEITVDRQTNLADISSGTSVLRAGVSIITINIGGEDANLQMGVSGGTASNTFIPFEPTYLPLGTYNNLVVDNTGENIDFLNISIGLNQKTCSSLGWIDVYVDFLNGSPLFSYIIEKNSTIIEQVTKQERQHQIFNLEEGDYQLTVIENNGLGFISKNFTILHQANLQGSECCADNLIIPAGEFNGLFKAKESIRFSSGTSIKEAKLYMCQN